MIIVIGRAEVDAANLTAVREAATEMMRATWAERGCLSYSLAVEDEGDAAAGRNAVLSIAERWENADVLKAHGATDHMRAFNKAIGRSIRGIDVKMYDATNERALGL
jgi:quinol monooxygenase YgiN